MKKLNVLFVCTETGGVNFFRAKQPHDALKALYKRDDYAIVYYDPNEIVRMGWEYSLYTDKSFETRSDLAQAVGWADVVIWMGLHSPDSLWFFKWCRLRYPYIKHIMEIDDYLLSSSRSNPVAGEVYRHGGDLAKIGLEQMKISDGLVVSTPYLAELYKAYAKRIFVVENAIDLKLWKRRGKEGKTLNIGWVGGGSHDDDLAVAKDAVFAILEKYEHVRFTIGHGAPEFFKHKPDCAYIHDICNPRYNKMKRCDKCGGIDGISWTHEFKTIDKYPKWVNGFKFDVGLAPLADLNFTRGKSNLRWLEYSAMGIPTIASPLNHFAESIKDGETGLIVKDNSTGGWIEAMERLILDKPLRQRIGNNARTEVKKNWNPLVMAKKYRLAIEEIYNGESNAVRLANKDRDVDKRSVEYAIHGSAETGGNREVAGTVCN